MKKQLFLILLTSFFILMAFPFAVQAQTTEVDSVTINFDCDELNVSWTHSAGTESGIILIDGSTYTFLLLQMFGTSSSSFTTTFVPPLAPTSGLIVDIGIFDALGELIAKTVVTVHCIPEAGAGAEPEPEEQVESVPLCGDGRLTFSLCEPVVVYPIVSETGVGWSIYLVLRGSDVGEFMLYLSAEDFENLPDELAENCTIASSENGHLVVYLLTSGEIQFNFGPDDEGKTFVYIFADLLSAPTRVETYMSENTPEILSACR